MSKIKGNKKDAIESVTEPLGETTTETPQTTTLPLEVSQEVKTVDVGENHIIETPKIEPIEQKQEIAEELKVEPVVEIPVDINPVVEYPKQEETIVIPTFEKDLSDKILVDKKLFYKMAYTLGSGHTGNYIGFSATRQIATMLGATTYEEQLKKWEEIKNGI